MIFLAWAIVIICLSALLTWWTEPRRKFQCGKCKRFNCSSASKSPCRQCRKSRKKMGTTTGDSLELDPAKWSEEAWDDLPEQGSKQ